MAACGVSDTYSLPTAGIEATGGNGGNGASGSGGNGGATGGNTGGNTGGAAATGGGATGGATNGGSPGTVGGIGPGGNGPGGNGPGGTGGNGPGGTGGNGPGGTNGTTGGTNGGGACAGELQPCGHGSSCCANLTCEQEPSAGGSFCETACGNGAGCTDAETVCSNGTCVLDVCGGNSSNGSYNGTCSANGTPGTCIPRGGGKNEYGICVVGGSSDGGCVVNAPTSQPANLCIAGEFCNMSLNNPADVCYTICDPGPGKGGKATCTAAGFTSCFPLGDIGVCVDF
jgi:hypothetical protein